MPQVDIAHFYGLIYVNLVWKPVKEKVRFVLVKDGNVFLLF